MKKVLFIAFILGLFAVNAEAKSVRGYSRSNGLSVSSHYRSSANSVKFDNYSSRGNVNPYTGKRGYSNPARTRSSEKPLLGNRKVRLNQY